MLAWVLDTCLRIPVVSPICDGNYLDHPQMGRNLADPLVMA